ncbi:espG family protein [Mycobacterium kansasii 732]|uniref:ESX-3 secretion-associated protein EspG3 n=1 Tax=Mycobacterium pseudokansasii TaxID=2341080 RepID=A0A498QLG2_9MYCO|nr:ESX secretion-associated protein EspG [Mycobacterium pseudokansasii]EUA15101.1 espG family protein [Mycobacterium kansasii 732]KZS64434.1 secretion protein EspG [Mycobacterium kansasii]MBY0391317.1 ESX secretion-associated protein EspG [Mycobacterium pseudokansasii]VAZ88473.1 ESX-3 secretion-associated protein EspG3 [Mycobacterium pseudokansasii]VAZ88963.1 ESX-3 secretion-associated protein EspG3 [Mycobacterium pseudokansasii]
MVAESAEPSQPNAVELTVDNAWFIAESVGAGSFPWVLAITPPYTDSAQRNAFFERQKDELTGLGLMSPDGTVNTAVADWIKVVCFPDRWLDLRYIGPASAEGTGELLRGIVARRVGAGGKTSRKFNTVVALRSAQLITFTAMDIDDPRALVPVLGVGLSQRAPARFEEFSMPMRVGARADERLRSGAPLEEVLDYLGIPASARPVVEAVFSGPRSYVEIVAGCNRDGQHTTTDVGLSIVDTTAGRVLVSPSRAFDGEWVSTFSPGTPFATAVAIEQLIANLPEGQWFPGQRLSRDFSGQPS